MPLATLSSIADGPSRHQTREFFAEGVNAGLRSAVGIFRSSWRAGSDPCQVNRTLLFSRAIGIRMKNRSHEASYQVDFSKIWT